MFGYIKLTLTNSFLAAEEDQFVLIGLPWAILILRKSTAYNECGVFAFEGHVWTHGTCLFPFGRKRTAIAMPLYIDKFWFSNSKLSTQNAYVYVHLYTTTVFVGLLLNLGSV